MIVRLHNLRFNTGEIFLVKDWGELDIRIVFKNGTSEDFYFNSKEEKNATLAKLDHFAGVKEL